jgi:hypothetical protein
MTLAQLRTRLEQYANRNDPDFLNNRDEFLRTGHRWVERKFLAAEPMYARWQVTEALAIGVGTLPLPGCYRHSAELRVYRLPDRVSLERIPPRGLRDPMCLHDGTAIDLRNTQQLGTPTYFAVLGRSLAIRPLPSTETDLEIVGTGWADPMQLDSDETVLTQEAPDAVLYAALREVWLFMGDDPQQTYWQTQAERAVQEWMADRIAEEHPPHLWMEVPG